MAFQDLTHEKAAEQHAMKRLFQRCGVAITTAEFQDLSAMCADGRAPVAGQGSSGGTLHRVSVRGTQAYAVFDPEVGTIVTFLIGEPWEVRMPHDPR